MTTVSKQTQDGTVTVSLEAYKHNYLIYRSIGSHVRVRGREKRFTVPKELEWILGSEISQPTAFALITLTNTYFLRGVAGLVDLDEDRECAEAVDCELKHSAWGFSINLTSGRPGAAEEVLPIVGLKAQATVVLENEVFQLAAAAGEQP